jgi:hypothetical protein
MRIIEDPSNDEILPRSGFVQQCAPVDIELHPLERTPQPNEESTDAEIQSAEKDLAIHE